MDQLQNQQIWLDWVEFVMRMCRISQVILSSFHHTTWSTVMLVLPSAEWHEVLKWSYMVHRIYQVLFISIQPFYSYLMHPNGNQFWRRQILLG
jgi:hypothetical protein